jgi:hypothetical protein
LGQTDYDIAKQVASAPFWRQDIFASLFSDDFTMDFTFAPPGMPTHFDTWEGERCFEWLNRTVRSWDVKLEEFYGTPPWGSSPFGGSGATCATPVPGVFWAVGERGGDVFWGGRDGHFHSKFFMRIELAGGKVTYIKIWMDPLAFLRAAGREVPRYAMDIYDPKVDEYIAEHPEVKHFGATYGAAGQGADLDMAPGAVAARRENNLRSFICGEEREKYRKLETFAPGFRGGAWFAPMEMPEGVGMGTDQLMDDHGVPPHLEQRMQAWVKASSPWMYKHPRGRVFATDDVNVWFVEMNGHGPARWRGNGYDYGHYHQPYLLIAKFDEAGRLTVRDEVLNPVNKYNCVNISLPSFPYYL